MLIKADFVSPSLSNLHTRPMSTNSRLCAYILHIQEQHKMVTTTKKREKLVKKILRFTQNSTSFPMNNWNNFISVDTQIRGYLCFWIIKAYKKTRIYEGLYIANIKCWDLRYNYPDELYFIIVILFISLLIIKHCINFKFISRQHPYAVFVKRMKYSGWLFNDIIIASSWKIYLFLEWFYIKTNVRYVLKHE